MALPAAALQGAPQHRQFLPRALASSALLLGRDSWHGSQVGMGGEALRSRPFVDQPSRKKNEAQLRLRELVSQQRGVRMDWGLMRSLACVQRNRTRSRTSVSPAPCLPAPRNDEIEGDISSYREPELRVLASLLTERPRVAAIAITCPPSPASGASSPLSSLPAKRPLRNYLPSIRPRRRRQRASHRSRAEGIRTSAAAQVRARCALPPGHLNYRAIESLANRPAPSLLDAGPSRLAWTPTMPSAP